MTGIQAPALNTQVQRLQAAFKPDTMCPLIVLRDKHPILASSAIGSGLQEKTLQVLVSILDFDMQAQAAAEAPACLAPDFGVKTAARVEANTFNQSVLDEVQAMGQKIKTCSEQEAGGYRGYWVGVEIQGNHLCGAGTRKLPIPAQAKSY